MKNSDAAHFSRVEQYAGNIYQMYLKTLRDITRLMAGIPIDKTKPFNFNDYPQIKQRADKYIQELTKKVKLQTENAISAEWLQGQVKNDEPLKQILKGSRLSAAQKKVYFSRNQDGVKAFLQRKTDGLNLSDRVWLYTTQYKNEIEMAVDVALAEKVSAQNLSQTVRQYLQQPETLFRRVRDKNGVLHLSQKAAAYHPGRGVYRSSYKNAMRLARTEINMAYRESDHERMNDLPFVTGFEVVLSNNHPIPDICDHLKGKYPKEFKFKGWHPQCRCHVVSKMVSDEEYNAIEDKLLAGEDISGYRSPNAIAAPPKGFSNWIADNKDRAKGWSSLPYFMKDNPGFVKGIKVVVPDVVKVVPEIAKVAEFIPAKSIKEANQWALQNLNVQFVDYAGLDVALANDMNKAVYKIKQLMPDIKTNGLGSAQAANRAMKAEITDFYSKSDNYKKYIDVYGQRLADVGLKNYVDKYVPKVGPNTIAWSTNQRSLTQKFSGEVRELNLEKYKGVFVNEKYGKKVDVINDIVKSNEKSGYYTKGAKDFGYITSHEFGHEIDKTIGFRDSDTFKSIYTREHQKGIKSVIENLSTYGATAGGNASHKPMEMIAESWAEFTTSSTPRALATEIGNLMLKGYYEYYVQGTGTTYSIWKNDIMKILKP